VLIAVSVISQSNIKKVFAQSKIRSETLPPNIPAIITEGEQLPIIADSPALQRQLEQPEHQSPIGAHQSPFIDDIPSDFVDHPEFRPDVHIH
jgi:hypothetical protein